MPNPQPPLLLCSLLLGSSAWAGDDDDDPDKDKPELEFLQEIGENPEPTEKIDTGLKIKESTDTSFDTSQFREEDEDMGWDVNAPIPDVGEGDPSEYMDDLRDVGDPGFTASPSQPACKPVVEAPVLPQGQGMKPLADNFPLRVVGKDLDSIVVELPVLVATSRHEAGSEEFWIVGVIEVDGLKVGEVRQLVASATLAELGPTFALLRAQVPVDKPRGKVTMSVERQVTSGKKPPQALFERSEEFGL